MKSIDYQRRYFRDYFRATRLKALQIVAGNQSICCVKCGYSDIRALQLDHKDGGGAKDRKVRSMPSIYLSIINGTELLRFQILCANCNWIKRHENQNGSEYGGRPRNKSDQLQIDIIEQEGQCN